MPGGHKVSVVTDIFTCFSSHLVTSSKSRGWFTNHLQLKDLHSVQFTPKTKTKRSCLPFLCLRQVISLNLKHWFGLCGCCPRMEQYYNVKIIIFKAASKAPVSWSCDFSTKLLKISPEQLHFLNYNLCHC